MIQREDGIKARVKYGKHFLHLTLQQTPFRRNYCLIWKMRKKEICSGVMEARAIDDFDRKEVTFIKLMSLCPPDSDLIRNLYENIHHLKVLYITPAIWCNSSTRDTWHKR